MPITITVGEAATAGQWSAALWSAAAVVGAASIAGFVALLGHIVARSNAKLQARLTQDATTQSNVIARKNAKLQTRLAANLKLAEMRQAWINSLRDDLSAFQSLGVTPELRQASEQEFYRLGTRIELFMNPADPDFPQLQSCLYRFLSAKTTTEKYRANPEFVQVCQRILKREWDVLKKELQSVADGQPDEEKTPKISNTAPARRHSAPAAAP